MDQVRVKPQEEVTKVLIKEAVRFLEVSKAVNQE
jgi:hypothetical protein